MFVFVFLGFHIGLVVAGQAEAGRQICHRDHGRRLGTVVRNVRHGCGERVVRSRGRPPAGHPHVPGGRLPGGRRVRRRPPVP